MTTGVDARDVPFAVQPFLDIRAALRDGRDAFEENLRSRHYQATSLSFDLLRDNADRLAHAAKRREESVRAIKNFHATNHAIQSKLGSGSDELDNARRASLDEEHGNLLKTCRDATAAFSALEQSVILPFLAYPNTLHAWTPRSDGDELLSSSAKTRMHHDAAANYSPTDPFPCFLEGRPAHMELWLMHELLNLLRRADHIPIAPPHLYQAVVAEGCGIPIDRLIAVRSESSKERTCYLLNHALMPVAAFFANSSLAAEDLPARLAFLARFHGRHDRCGDSAPSSGGVSEPLVAAAVRLEAEDADFGDVVSEVSLFITNILTKFHLPWQVHLTAAVRLRCDESLRFSIRVAQPDRRLVEVAQVSSAATYLSKRIRLTCRGTSSARLSFPGCVYATIDVSRLAILLSDSESL